MEAGQEELSQRRQEKKVLLKGVCYLVLVGLEASNEEGIAGTQGLHEGVQRAFELSRQGSLLGACLAPGFGIRSEEVDEELVRAHDDSLEEIVAEGVAILLQKALRKVEDLSHWRNQRSGSWNKSIQAPPQALPGPRDLLI